MTRKNTHEYGRGCRVLAHRHGEAVELENDGVFDELVVAPETIRLKWLYLVLAWIFEHQEFYADPLQTVEEVYADFDYPEAIVPFVRYMPMTGPDLGSKEANERRLYENWQSYLNEMAKAYGSGLDPAQD